jgi:hypothetical protein
MAKSKINPSHYQDRGGIEPIDFIVTNSMSFLEGNIIKYVYRQTCKEDLLKAKYYLDKLIEEAE